MASEFFTILTAVGRKKIAAALAEQKQVFLQTMVVGDGNGKYVEPSETQTKVVHEVWRGQLNTLKLAPENPAWVIAEAVLPEDVGGWYIREVGLVDKDGDLIAIGKFPETYKPKLPAGASKQIVIRAVMEVTNATVVTLMIDPTVVVATREYVDSLLSLNTEALVMLGTAQVSIMHRQIQHRFHMDECADMLAQLTTSNVSTMHRQIRHESRLITLEQK